MTAKPRAAKSRTAKRPTLLKVLQKLEKRIATDALKRAKAWPNAHWAALHAASETGGPLRDYLKVVAGRSAVHFLLRTVFVRALEDLGLIPKTLRGHRRFQAFQAVAPSLGHRAYFEWIFRDLAHDLPDLFATRTDDLGPPNEELCREVWDVWHAPDEHGALLYDWAPSEAHPDRAFDSRFLGDLYQDLDQDVRKRFALLQTPDFVEKYILDHTLTPALETFDPQRLQAQGETFRLLDPTCGSGHFLIGGFHRLANWWQTQGLSAWDAAETALDSVWGCDINPHAVYIARFRLMLEVMQRTGVRDLKRLAGLRMNLRTLDALVPWERREDRDCPGIDRLESYGEPDERAANAVFLKRDFHAVVGNPPYITPKDTKKRNDYRVFWPESAAGKYGLAAPFVERLFALGCTGGYIGQITANAFIKRSYGISLIEKVLPRWDLTDIIDTSGAYIPGHGTPTVILFGRAQSPISALLRVVGGKRGEPKAPDNAAEGKVWRAIVEAPVDSSDDDLFVTVSAYTRKKFSEHPWNVNGGGAPELQILLSSKMTQLETAVRLIGFGGFTGTDEIFVLRELPQSLRLSTDVVRPLVPGDAVRDFNLAKRSFAVVPYERKSNLLLDKPQGIWLQSIWKGRTHVLAVKSFGGKTRGDLGDPWWSWYRWNPDRLSGYRITFAFVATHNHFVLDRGGKVFKQSAPVIKLPAEASLADHLDLLGLLNSSTLGFWMKQVFFNKGDSTDSRGARVTGEAAFDTFEYDSTKLKRAPIATADREARVALATALDATAQARAACLPAAVLAQDDWTAETLSEMLDAARSQHHELTERMVALQEELDWLTYHSYGLLDDADVSSPEEIEPLAPGHRPFEILLARHNAACDPDERSAWFTRHGHDEVTTIPTRYADATRARMEARLALIASNRDLKLIEQPQFKRRWQLPNLHDEAQKAARAWLLDRLEDLFADGGALSEPQPYTLEAVVGAWRSPKVTAVAAVLQGTHNFDLSLVAERLLVAEALPDNPFRLYTAAGLLKWRVWQETWRLQDREDAGETVKIDLPPKFAATDFQRAEYMKIRGKLNVPRERFIVFADLTPPQYGWNGWRDEARGVVQVHAYECAEGDPVNPLPPPTSLDPRRCGATIGLWEALPDVKRWGDADVHEELSALPSEACGQNKCPCDIGKAWQKWHAGGLKIEGVEAPDPNAATVTEKGDFMRLLEQHQPAEAGLSAKAMGDAWKGEGHKPGRFTRVKNELLASGDIANLGRGKRGGLRTVG